MYCNLGLFFWKLMRSLLQVLILNFSYLFHFVVPAGYSPIQHYFEFWEKKVKKLRITEGATGMICSMLLILHMKKLLPGEHMCWNSGENSGFYTSFPKSIPSHTWPQKKTRVRPSVKPCLYIKTSFLIDLASR